jgi:hypothetical protein
MTTQPSTAARAATFTRSQWYALHALRQRYQQDRDLFSAQERMRLRFVRWLYRVGRRVT